MTALHFFLLIIKNKNKRFAARVGNILIRYPDHLRTLLPLLPLCYPVLAITLVIIIFYSDTNLTITFVIRRYQITRRDLIMQLTTGNYVISRKC